MSNKFDLREHVVRTGDASLRIQHPDAVGMTLMATAEVPVEDEAIVQAVDFARLSGTLDDLWQRQSRGGSPVPTRSDSPRSRRDCWSARR